jgi:phage tail-like protein
MPIERTNPYGSFNFLVDFNTGDRDTVRGGFQEVSGMNIEVTSGDYRAGNDKANHVRKINGIYKVSDVTLKRGLIGSLDLYQWINSIRTGDHTVLRTVHISLQDEAHNGPVMTWTLTNARPTRYVVPAFNAKTGTEVAVEELTLAVEDLTVE